MRKITIRKKIKSRSTSKSRTGSPARNRNRAPNLLHNPNCAHNLSPAGSSPLWPQSTLLLLLFLLLPLCLSLFFGWLLLADQLGLGRAGLGDCSGGDFLDDVRRDAMHDDEIRVVEHASAG